MPDTDESKSESLDAQFGLDWFHIFARTLDI